MVRKSAEAELARRAYPWSGIEALAIIAMSVAIGMAYFFPWSTLPKTESLDYSTLPMIDFWSKLQSGTFPVWNFDVALGSPWPPPHGLEFTPLSPLLTVMSPMRFVGLTVIFHSIISLFCLRELLRRFEIDRWIRLLCLLTFSWLVGLDYVYWYDAIEVYVGFTLLPVLLLCLDIVLGDGERRNKIIAATALGATVGYGCMNAHPGTFVLYLAILGIAALFRPLATIRNASFLVISGFVSGAILVGKVLFLLNELQHMPADALRVQQGLSETPFRMFWTAVLRPLFIPDLTKDFGLGSLLSDYVLQNVRSTFLFVGLPFLVACLSGLRGQWADERLRPIVAGFVLSTSIMLIPIRWLPVALSATYPARDTVLLFAVILAGRVFADPIRTSGWLSRRVMRSGAWFQAATVSLAAIPMFWGFNLAPQSRYPTVATIERAAAGKESQFARTMRGNFALDDPIPPRIATSGHMTVLSQYEVFYPSGLFLNVGIAVGYADVGFMGKGISYDGLRRTIVIPYGMVAGDRLQNFASLKNPFYPDNPERDWPINDQNWLTLLGIAGVIALKTNHVSASELDKIADLPAVSSNLDYTIYKNRAVFGRAFWVPKLVLDQNKLLTDRCNDGSFYCYDAGPVVASASALDGHVSFGNGEIDVAFAEPPGKMATTHDLLITNYFRPEWETSSGRISTWHGLTRLSVPGDTKSFRLYYDVRSIVALRLMGYAVLTVLYLLAAIMLINWLAGDVIRRWKAP